MGSNAPPTSTPVNSEMRRHLWRAMLDADMNVRYWKYLCQDYLQRERMIKIFLAITTSGTVASWTVWSDLPILWKALSAISAVVSIISPFLNYQATIEALSTLSGKWWEAKRDYEGYWTRLESGESTNELQKEFDLIKAREGELIKMETKLPHNAQLLTRCQEEVLRSHGFSNA